MGRIFRRIAMKKGLFVLAFGLITMVMFADESLTVYTSEGTYNCEHTVLSGWDVDEQLANWFFNMRSGLTSSVWVQKLTSGQEECIRRVLGLYRTTRGDSFRIIMRDISRPIMERTVVFFYCKFTSNTQYQWWAHSIK
jgi:hypothetical protein